MATAPRRGIKPKIKPPKKHGPAISVEETWSTLSQNIKEILNHNAANLSFEENHRYAYHLVLYKNGDILYRGMKKIVAENLDRLAKEEIISAFPTTGTGDPMQRSQENELLLKALKSVWDDHTSNMAKLGQILKYMDRIYTKPAEVPETWEAGLQLFLKHIICPPIKDHLLTAILNQIQYEREGYTINRSAVKGCVEVLLSLDSDDNALTAFETFINSNDKCSEFISLFIDDHLKRGLKGKTDEEVDVVLDKTITVFRYLTEKDVFERYYKNHLAKRLIQAKSVSDDAERGMLAKLKIECGYQFTQKLEGMFHDIKISADTMKSYKEHLAKSIPSLSIDLSVIVMTSTFWPSHSSSPCNLPQQLLDTIKPFEEFYLSQHSGRRLTWQLSLGNVDVRVAFKSKKHDLNVTTFAAVILLLFEDLKDDDFLTYEDIQQATSIDHADLQRQLQSLACAKYKVLRKHPPGRDVQSSDAFSFNSAFTAPLQKLKISTVSSKVESGEELKETRDRIDEERRHQTEACIVRIMKDRKHMSHNDLVNEVTRLLASRFQPNPLIIKKRIEGLIERDYLERAEDRKSYNYLA
ncbi:Cullin-domain-containing protein [Lentinula edodes]|uniref:Cullin-domain-containing protein n=1 Tax=Lentinula edodes TaxID=5353 RepID=A0A1Q3ES32_LENED|nr:Cullin-domain-containing protein [Lentinula edodes]